MKVDCHIHMVLDGVDWKAAVQRHESGVREDYVRSVLEGYRRAGYTWLRSGGDKWGVSALARSVAPEYGIGYVTPLAPISKAGHYGGFIGEQFCTLQEYAQLVRKRREQGADFIKLMISGLMEFHSYGALTQEALPAQEIREMVHIAHSEGFAVMVHANGARTVEAAAEAGVDSVEHGAYLDAAALAAMVENAVVWVPTVSTVGNLWKAGATAEALGRGDTGAVERILDALLKTVASFSAMGGLVASGSDAGAWAVPHGCGTEDAWLAKAGVDPADGNRKIMERFSGK